ncbi:F-box/WD repeat-containing protein 7 [Habropoda laboriosa]|uniref:F-box/WD repeat-containing protein 7 n=1 Tax=Habropoda laboriosa TaxID=597456 RepID=A0A0L7QS69_9HYME|nr:F-box/WD repeat-containing protein 7 [Habropoda laboriosa]
MSVPSSSSNKITDNKPGGTSPSPIEGIEGVPGPSSLEPMHSLLTQDEESEDYGEDGEEEEEDDSSEEESEISDTGIFCDAECEPELKSNNCSLSASQPQSLTQRVHSPVLHTCVPLDVVQPQRKRKSETESSLPCKKLNPEDKSHSMIVKKLDDKSKHVRCVIPTKDNPPPEMSNWLLQFQRWSNAERMLAIDELIERCEPTQVRHMMQVIEPQFQRDFISLLPKELALSVLAFLEPRDLLRAAQTCRNWRFLADDNLLWKEKCRAAGIEDLKDLPPTKRKNCRNSGNSSSPWKQAYMRQHNIKMNWRTKPIRTPKILKGHDDHVITCLQFSGNRIVSGSDDNTLKVWSAVTGKCLRTLVGHTGGVWSSQMFDGVHVVSGSLDTSIRVWEVETGACRHTLMGHQSLTSGMELRNNILVSGNADSTVKVWDIVSGHCLQTLSGPNKHQSAVTCLQFNSHFVITSSDDGTVKLWDVKTGDFIRNLVALESGGSGGVVWRIRASDTKLVCAVGSRNGTEETKLLVLDFDVEVK